MKVPTKSDILQERGSTRASLAERIVALSVDLDEADRMLAPFKGLIGEPWYLYEKLKQERDDLADKVQQMQARLDELLPPVQAIKEQKSFIESVKRFFGL